MSNLFILLFLIGFFVIILFIFLFLFFQPKVVNDCTEIMYTQCETKSGKCNEIGNKTSYKICNNVVKYINSTPCSINCRYSIWEDFSTTDCIDNKKTITKKCINNDAYGINTCTYQLSNDNGSLDNYIPEGCTLDNNIISKEHVIKIGNVPHAQVLAL